MQEGPARAGLATAFYSSSSTPHTSPQRSGGSPSASATLLLASSFSPLSPYDSYPDPLRFVTPRRKGGTLSRIALA